LNNAVQDIFPTITQHVAMVMRELKHGLACQLCLVVHAEVHRQLINALRHAKQSGKLAQGYNDIVENIGHHVASCHLRTLPSNRKSSVKQSFQPLEPMTVSLEAVDTFLNDGRVQTLIVNKRKGGDSLPPNYIKYFEIVRAGRYVHKADIVTLTASNEQFPQVVVAHGTRLLGRHHNFLTAYGVVDFLEHLVVKVLVPVDLRQVLLELFDDHRNVLLLDIVVVLVDV
jgi:hypothetical protein